MRQIQLGRILKKKELSRPNATRNESAYYHLGRLQICPNKMEAETLALAQEEATLTKIRTALNHRKVKLWEAPYYAPERRAPEEAMLHQLAVELKVPASRN
jgi:hypothetical protein